MTHVNINPVDYVSDSDIKREVLCAIRKHFSKSSDFERILSNACYRMTQKLVDDAMDEKMEDIIKEKTVEIINNLSSYSVFKGPDAWDRDVSTAYHVVSKTVNNNKSLIEELTVEHVKKYIPSVVAERMGGNIEEAIFDAIVNSLHSKGGEQ